jgi:hypothetical protein
MERSGLMGSVFQKMRLGLVALVIVPCLVLGNAPPASAVDEKMLERMEKIIQQQQAQLGAQAKAIEALQKQVQALSQSAATEATEAAKAEVAKAAVPSDAVRAQEGDKVAVKLYGQVNRAYLGAVDGHSSHHFFVDNDNASSRIGLLGAAKVSDDVTIGTKMEFEYQSNPSNLVHQANKNPDGASFDDRWIDAQLTSKRFGKFYLGKGPSASDGSSEVDLSGTSVVGYSSVVDMAGGILFFDTRANNRSTTAVGDVFSNFDDLSRRNRFRYDSPSFWGFGLAGSVLSDGGDVVLTYASKWGEDLKLAAAIAYINPQSTNRPIDHVFNGSASILHRSGINLTLAAGEKEPADSSRHNPAFYYGKLGYIAKWFTCGETRFSVDYNVVEDLDQNGDEAQSAGLQVVQDLPRWGSEYYLGYRWHDLERVNADLDAINAWMTGVRLKF